MTEYARYLGWDQHKDTIVVALARAGREPDELLGRIRNREEDIAHWLEQRRREWGSLDNVLVTYEAGPCGYGAYRQLRRMKVACQVIAPSLTPRKPGERVRTDRRDAGKLARLSRAGELTSIWVPDEAHEALRDLIRAREVGQEDVLRLRNRLSKFLLRQGCHPPEGVHAWTQAYDTWLHGLTWAQPTHQMLVTEMRQAILSAKQRVQRLEASLAEAVAASPWAPTVVALQSFRGVELVVAATLVAEIGAIGRFVEPRDLMSYSGLVPAEDSSGQRVRRSSTGHTGNHHLRRVLVEAAWAYIHRPQVGPRLERRQRGQPEELTAIAWRAQVRLHKRYRDLLARGKDKNKAVVAIARELCGFIWEALQTMPLPKAL